MEPRRCDRLDWGPYRAPTAALLCFAIFIAARAVGAGEGGIDPTAFQSLFGMAGRGGGGGGGGAGGGSRVDVASLQALLAKERNIFIEEQGDVIVVDGRVSSLASKRRLEKILARYENILDLTEFIQDEDAIIARAAYLQQKIHDRLNASYDPARAFVPPQRVEYDIVENEVVIIGELNNQDDIGKVSQIIGTYERTAAVPAASPQPVPQGGEAPPPAAGGAHLGVRKQPVEISVVFARMSGADQNMLGVSGLTSAVVTVPTLNISPPTPPPATTNPLRAFNNTHYSAEEGSFQVGENGSVTMNFSNLVNSGAILARPHLSALNGTEARFHSGGQVGIQTINDQVAAVEWKDYGTILTVTPTLTTDGRIHLKIVMEFTAPIGNLEYMRFEHESEAIVAANQGVVLSGMVKEIRNQVRHGVPFLRKIPILGFFFGNKEKVVDNEEMMVVVIPRAQEVVECGPFVTGKDTVRILNGVICNMNEEKEGDRREREKRINRGEPYQLDIQNDTQFRLGEPQPYAVPQYNRREEGAAPSGGVPPGGTSSRNPAPAGGDRLISDLVEVR